MNSEELCGKKNRMDYIINNIDKVLGVFFFGFTFICFAVLNHIYES